MSFLQKTDCTFSSHIKIIPLTLSVGFFLNKAYSIIYTEMILWEVYYGLFSII